MVAAYQPLARLVCLILLTVRLIGGQAGTQSAGDPRDGLEAAGLAWAAPSESTSAGPMLMGGSQPTALFDAAYGAPAKPVAKKPSARKLYRVCRVTAYCDRGLTASGIPSGLGQCAAPAYIPLGSRVYIPALRRSFVVTDRTHPRFRQNTVDIFVGSKDRCLQFGCRYLECEFTLPENPASAGIRVAGR